MYVSLLSCLVMQLVMLLTVMQLLKRLLCLFNRTGFTEIRKKWHEIRAGWTWKEILLSGKLAWRISWILPSMVLTQTQQSHAHVGDVSILFRQRKGMVLNFFYGYLQVVSLLKFKLMLNRFKQGTLHSVICCGKWEQKLVPTTNSLVMKRREE